MVPIEYVLKFFIFFIKIYTDTIICYTLKTSKRENKMRKKIARFIFICTFFLMGPSSLISGWSHHTHINYLREAIRILPVFDYEMCVYYYNHLAEGAVEGEIHYRYITKGKYPSWLKKLTKDEIKFLNGIPINALSVKDASTFFAKRFEALKNSINSLKKPYSQIFFELGYYLHSINNTLIPEYQGGKCPWQQMGSNTDSIDIKTANIHKISNLNEWLLKTLKKNLAIRSDWTKMAESENKDGFMKIAKMAHERNIYNTGSIIQYVLNDCFGPADPKVRKKVAAIHEKKLNSNDGRKPNF